MRNFLLSLFYLILHASTAQGSNVGGSLLLSNLEIWKELEPSIAINYLCNDKFMEFPQDGPSIFQNFIVDLDAFMVPHRSAPIGLNSSFDLQKIQAPYLARLKAFFQIDSGKFIQTLFVAHQLCGTWSGDFVDVDDIFNRILFNWGFKGINKETLTNAYHLHICFLAYNFYTVHCETIDWKACFHLPPPVTPTLPFPLHPTFSKRIVKPPCEQIAPVANQSGKVEANQSQGNNINL